MALYLEDQTCTNTYNEDIAMRWDPNDVMFGNDSSLSITTSSSIILPSVFNRDALTCPTSNGF